MKRVAFELGCIVASVLPYLSALAALVCVVAWELTW